MTTNKPVEPLKDIVVKTIRELSYQGTFTPDQMRDLATEIEKSDLKDRMCCPFCEEIQCDGGCPLETLRSINSKQSQPVSHVMPESVREILQWMELSGGPPPGTVFRACKALEDAYAKIAEQQEQIAALVAAGDFLVHIWGEPSEGQQAWLDAVQVTKSVDNKEDVITSLKSQLSTLQAQMKEVVKAGDSVKSQLEQEEPNCFQGMIDNWKYVTASLRQSGQK